MALNEIEGRSRLPPFVCAPHVRHFIVHPRRAGHVVTRPLNSGVTRKASFFYLRGSPMRAESAVAAHVLDETAATPLFGEFEDFRFAPRFMPQRAALGPT